MATAGYSGTPLFKKLGIKTGMKLLLLHPPDQYADWLGEDFTANYCQPGEVPDLVQVFAKSYKEMETGLQQVIPFIRQHPGITIWVSWYKKAARIPTDLSEDLIRDYALKNGLVDVKVCAVNEQWSALKLVVPLRNR